jgi:hypothetical protein
LSSSETFAPPKVSNTSKGGLRRGKGGRIAFLLPHFPLLENPPLFDPPPRIIPLHDVRIRGFAFAHPLGFSAWTPALATSQASLLFLKIAITFSQREKGQYKKTFTELSIGFYSVK